MAYNLRQLQEISLDRVSVHDGSECLSKLVLLGEGHLRVAVREYLVHYHQERNHQGLGGQLILPPANLNRPGPIVCRERLGGLLRFYHREAV